MSPTPPSLHITTSTPKHNIFKRKRARSLCEARGQSPASLFRKGCGIEKTAFRPTGKAHDAMQEHTRGAQNVPQNAAISTAHCTVKGAREANEDHQGTLITPSYAMSFICDGHGGGQMAQLLGQSFLEHLRELSSHLAPDVTPSQLADALRQAYWGAVHWVDESWLAQHQGSTLSAVLLQ